MLSAINKIKSITKFVYPHYPQDNRVSSRVKRGLMNYAAMRSRWGFSFLQEFIKEQRFSFRYERENTAYNIKVSGGDASHLWAADEVFTGESYDLSQVTFCPDVVLDLGANIGMFTLLSSVRWPQAAYICVEPHPVTFSFLCENLAINHVTASKLQCAVSDKVGFQFLQDPFALSQKLVEHGDHKTRTLTLLLDSLIPLTKNSKLLIKMDIEGSEVFVLSNLKTDLPKDCFIFLELHNGNASIEWVTHWANANGFEYVQGRRSGLAIDGFLRRF